MESQSTAPLIRWLVTAAGVFGAMGVVTGSLGAHGLESWLVERGIDSDVVLRRLDQWDVGVRYHLVHAVGLLGLAALAATRVISYSWIKVVGLLMVVGLILFSGSLYLLVALNLPVMGAITPLGGASWIAAWSSLALSGVLSGKSDGPAKP